MKSNPPPTSRTNLPHKLRIIGGEWRGRKLDFPPLDAIRPTPDRVRETVFNWLQNHIAGAHCLDLFAGSGALGFEALSRGAQHATFVDCEPTIVRYLRATLSTLKGVGETHLADAIDWLDSPSRPFDVVFLDPPFADALLPQACRKLEANGWLAPNALIYMESAARNGTAELPVGWTLIKSNTAGQVGYHLARRNAP